LEEGLGVIDADAQIFTFVKENLYTGVVCDVLDSLGYRQQAMHPRLRPLLPERQNCGFVGRARTFRWMETDYIVQDDPYGLELEAMDSLASGDVVVHSTDYRGDNAPWGELMSTVARRNGAVGCICDSQVRDCLRIIAMGFPVYYAGICPLDSQGRARVMAYDVPVRCGEVLVHPGELVFADFDGIVVVPRQVEAQALQLAMDKADKETASRQALLAGKSLQEVYRTYGVL
jgi:4-hydroxy-4-methyl-2-oxoglutarate aldolase